MTDLKQQLARLVDAQPDAPYDVERVVRAGRRARRRHRAVVTAAGTLGAAGVAAAVVVPVVTLGGTEASVRVADRPPATPTAATTGKCYAMAAPRHEVHRELDRMIRSGKVGAHPSVTRLKGGGHGRVFLDVCTEGASPVGPRQESGEAQPPAGPPYHYTEQPAAIAARLGAHLHERISGLGLEITFTRPFSQEKSGLDHGHPSYFGGNVDVHEASGYADVGVQVRHAVTELVPFTGSCTAAEHCTQTTLPDGSVLRTGRVDAGSDAVVLTAEVHRPDGVVVQAQESNYPFGPAAAGQRPGDQPLTLDQLTALAQDDAFTF